MIGGSLSYRKEVLSKFTEEDIFELAGFPVQQGYFTNPYRNDKRPGCSFRRRRGILFLCDPTDFFPKACVTCFGAIKFMKNIRSDNETYKYILDNCTKTKSTIEYKSEDLFDIKFTHDPWQSDDMLVRQGFSPEILRKEGFFKVRDYTVDFGDGPIKNYCGNPRYHPCIAMVFPSGNIKLYFYTRKKRRFFTNTTNTDIWGDFYAGEYLFITKSGKDYLTLKYICNLPVIGVQQENYVPEILGYKKVIILFDNDVPGFKNSLKLAEKNNYITHNILIPYSDPFEVLENEGKEFTFKYFNNYVE